MSKWTEGVCSDGAAILRDGQPVPISELLDHLNRCESIRSLNDAETQFDDVISADSASGRLDPFFDAARHEIDNGNVSDATPGDKT